MATAVQSSTHHRDQLLERTELNEEISHQHRVYPQSVWERTLFSVKLVVVTFPAGLATLLLLAPPRVDPSALRSRGCEIVAAVADVGFSVEAVMVSLDV